MKEEDVVKTVEVAKSASHPQSKDGANDETTPEPDTTSNGVGVQEAGVDKQTKKMHEYIAIIYGVGLLIWIALFFSAVGMSVTKKHPAVLFGFAFATGLMILNLILGQREHIAPYRDERDEADMLNRAGFYSLAAVLSLSGALASGKGRSTSEISALLMLSVFFGIIIVQMPVWVSTEESEPMIITKHAKTVSFCWSLGFLVAGLALIYFSDRRKLAKALDGVGGGKAMELAAA
jgi:hypothetical protein